MKTTISIFTICLALLFFVQQTFTQDTQETKSKEIRHWWNEAQFGKHFQYPDAKKLPLISVKGNRFVNSLGDTVLFRGISISDPDKLEAQGHWNKNHFVKIKEMGARIVRIPVHPVAWRERTPEKYLALLDQALEWCTELDMYIIIDWHTIGNLKTELFQNPMYNTTMKETLEFWRAVAARYAGINTIPFYEIFNEPTSIQNRLGRISWDEWKKINEDIIALIRSYNKESIPLVAPFDWAYDLTPLHINPIEAERIGYVTHPYANKRSKPWEQKWEEDFGFAANQYPVIATEFGFTGSHGVVNEYSDYGDRIIKYLEEKGISWVAWIFDPEWTPSLISSWDTYKLTESGEFFKKAMQDTTHTIH
ncbi:MAG: cellulase family glycosylhydrolase [Bacteroidota bacterium]